MKVFKKIMAACLAGVAAMSMAVTASADMAETAEFSALAVNDSFAAQAYKEGFSLVSEEKVADEEDENVIYQVRLFKRSENDGVSAVSANEITTDPYRLEVDVYVSSYPLQNNPVLWATMWLQGSYSYDGKDYAAVSGAAGGVVLHGGIKFKENPKVTSKSNQGANFLLGKKYAIVRVDTVLTNGSTTNNQHSFHISLDVNVEGTPKPYPRDAVPEKIE